MAGKSLTEQMAAAAADAVKLTDTYFTEELDYSEASVATVERLVDDIPYSMPKGKTEANIDLLCRVWAPTSGRSSAGTSAASGLTGRTSYGKAIAFQSGGVKVFPMDKVRKRITRGAEHNLRDYFAVFRDQMSAGK